MVSTTIEKQQWIDKYTKRMLKLWQRQQPTFKIDPNYSRHLTEQLTEFFDDSLKKELIESTY